MTEEALLTGLFADLESVERACAALARRGYTAADVRLLMSGEARDRFLAAAMRRRDGALSQLVPALIRRPIPRERAMLYAPGVARGGIVMAVAPRTPEDAEQFQIAWAEAGGAQVLYPAVTGAAA
jgi:hypothetical protein